MQSKAENRILIVKALEQHRGLLGDDQFDQMINEINEVSYAYMIKKQALRNQAAGTMDKNGSDERRLNREEDLKWVLIKQKYGI